MQVLSDPAEILVRMTSDDGYRIYVEVPPAAWGPRTPPPQTRAPSIVLLVDGVLRTDAWLWIEEADGTMHPGLAASYAAGVVRCDLRRGVAEVAPTRIDRGLFTPSARARDLV